VKLVFDCAICRSSLEADDVEPAQAELLNNTWATNHQHSQAERDAYEASLKDFRDG